MSVLDPDPGFRSRTSLIQLGYGIWVNMTTLGIGLAHGLPAIQIPQLNSPASDILLTVEEASWIASVLTLFCPIGSLTSGFLMDKLGRRVMIAGCQIPMCMGWLYTGSALSAKHIIIGRAITGIGCGMAMGPPRLYTTEISLANMRGVIGALPNAFLALGITIQAALGSFMAWKKLCYFGSIISLLLFFSYFFLEETPHFLLLKGNSLGARKALASFRAKTYHVDQEMNQLIEFKQDNNIRSLNVCDKIRAMFTHSTCRPFGIVMTYILVGTMSGCAVVTFWTIELLLSANSSLNVHAGNFGIAITRLLFGIMASVLLYHIGRRPMSMISAGGVGFACITLGLIVKYVEDPTVAPQLLFMLFTASASLGFYILPFLMMSELYPLQIRGMLIGISISITNILSFGTAKLFPYLRDSIGISNTLFVYGTCALLGFIFLFVFLPETKGLTLQEIEEYFNDRRPALVSERSVMNAQIEGFGSRRELIEQYEASKLKKRESIQSERSFVDVSSLKSSSVTSLGSKRSVTLQIEGKRFVSLTNAEKEELQHVIHEAPSTPTKLEEAEDSPIAHFFLDRGHAHDKNAEEPKPATTNDKANQQGEKQENVSKKYPKKEDSDTSHKSTASNKSEKQENVSKKSPKKEDSNTSHKSTGSNRSKKRHK